MNRWLPVLAVIIAAASWGMDGVALRPALYALPVPLVVLIESALAAVLFLPAAWKYRRVLADMPGKYWFAFAAVALFGGALGTMAITRALFYVHFVNLSVVALIQKLQPVFALFFAGFFLGERLPGRFFGWAALALLASYLMAFGLSLPNISSAHQTVAAVAFSLLAAVSFAASTVLSKYGLKNLPFPAAVFLRFAMTTLIMLLIATGGGSIAEISQVNPKQWFVFGIILFTSGGAAIFLYYYGLRRISASVSAICELAFPLTAILLEYFLRGNLLTFPQWVGVLILILAISRVLQIQNALSKESLPNKD
jgi:drug/metabolite transporter (DMT)-like permease